MNLKSEIRPYYEGTKAVVLQIATLKPLFAEIVRSTKEMHKLALPSFLIGIDLASEIVKLSTTQHSQDIATAFTALGRDLFTIQTNRNIFEQAFNKEVIIPLEKHLRSYEMVLESFLYKYAVKEISTLAELNEYKKDMTSFKLSVMAEKDQAADNVHKEAYVESIYVLRAKFTSIASHLVALVEPLATYVESCQALCKNDSSMLSGLTPSMDTDQKFDESPLMLYSHAKDIAFSTARSRESLESVLAKMEQYANATRAYALAGIKVGEAFVNLGKSQHGDDVEQALVLLGQSMLLVFNNIIESTKVMRTTVSAPLKLYLDTEEEAIVARLERLEDRVNEAKQKYVEAKTRVAELLCESSARDHDALREAKRGVNAAFIAAFEESRKIRRKPFCGFACRLLPYLDCVVRTSGLVKTMCDSCKDTLSALRGETIPSEHALLADTLTADELSMCREHAASTDWKTLKIAKKAMGLTLYQKKYFNIIIPVETSEDENEEQQ